MTKRYVSRMTLVGVLLCAAVLLIQPMGAVFSQQSGEKYDTETLRLVDQIRTATAAFRDVNNAVDAGYTPFLDCVASDTEGGMGQHYVNWDLVGDGIVDPLQPEVVVYEPGADGSLTFVALDYLVPLALWTEADPPELFGQPFHQNTDITAKYADAKPAWILHLWIGTHNPNGMLTDYNPAVFCPADASS
jgi:hypothetical protein